MKIVVSMDSFKGSLTTLEAGLAVEHGIRNALPQAEISVLPLADGGEGSMDVIIHSCNATRKGVKVQNPVGRYIETKYAVLKDGSTAVLEMASAAGLTLISESEQNPMHTTTYGVGEMIRAAINDGCRKFIVGIGGSATNDGGTGMLSALGFEFLDENGKEVPCGAEGLSLIHQIKSDKVLPQVFESEFIVACDVQNPLCGENGCSYIYGPQKGADSTTVHIMDEGMRNFEAQTKKFNPKADGNFPGSGAAGGLGFAFLAYLNGTLKSGIELIIAETGLEEKIKTADLVVTGEGRIDSQSCMGKTISGIAEIAKKYNKPVIAFCGCVSEDAIVCNSNGIDAFFPVLRTPCTLEEAMKDGQKNLTDTVEQVFRLINRFIIRLA